MLRCRPWRLSAPIAAIVFLGLLSPGPLAAQGVEYIKSHYTKYEYRIPMRDGVRLFTSVYVPKEQTQRYPILLSRTPYSVEPYGVDSLQVGPGPLGSVWHRGLHRGLPGRPRALDVGGRVRQHAAAPAQKTGPARHRREHRHLRHDRLADQASAQPQRPGRDVGDLLPRLLHGRRDDRRPSRAQGGIAAGTRHRLVCRRRLASQRCVPPAARLQLPLVLRPSPPPADQERQCPSSSTVRPTAMRSILAWDRSPTPMPAISRTMSRSGTRSCSTGPTTNSGRRATCGRI